MSLHVDRVLGGTGTGVIVAIELLLVLGTGGVTVICIMLYDKRPSLGMQGDPLHTR